ncbi:MAG TPA: ABC transporter permease [Methanoregulaceae archaeon]|nr:MAG: ABC transporter permease [Methanolinea sp.]HON82233.1 ABC transporter permease [Methanoregulaceae archaeon]HPD10994.1 ABC transporter permease [Methanoregulaceae archaeon]HRT15205.1 ABC transporter permease [Methanoregulaceae archaeon]HRU30678.1 ABC transporter permease [Methanoregulaceae archaeon]
MKDILYYFERDFLRWIRGRLSVVSALIMPAAWLIFVGLALPTSFTTNYIDFITPGILVLTMLGAALQGGSLLIFDKILGFLNKFLALPAPRESILFGKIFFITTRGLLQATVILVLAFLLGAALFSPAELLLTYGILALFGLLISAFSTTVALHLSDHDAYAAFNAMVSMPFFFTSSALMPYDVMPAWLRPLAYINPVSYAIDSIRALQGGVILWARLGLLVSMAAVVIAVSVYRFRKVTL